MATSTAERQLHLVCNAHLDPVWLWEWEEGAASAISTFRVAAELCEQNPSFIFCHNEVILYEWVEEYEPELFVRIQKLVKAGRWHIMGGWFLQPDCNMPEGEAFIRQILVGRRYFAEKFGSRPTTAINFDPFGHTRGLVQIMAKSGYDSYYICRPSNGECPLPAETFTWVGYDGSEVTVQRSPEGYNSPLGLAHTKVEGWMNANPEKACGVVLWGVGNHGGGPSKIDVKRLGELFRETKSLAVRHSTPEAYFAAINGSVNGDRPRVESSLNPFAVGCYTSQIRIKKNYRLLENMLFMTEKMAAAAAGQGLAEYPRAELAEAQRDLLICMFHDILPGSSAQPTEEASLRFLSHGQELVSRARARMFFALARGQKKAKEGEIPILVFNPHPYPVKAVVECEFQLQDQNWAPNFTNVHVFQGATELPTQVEKEVSNLNLDWRKKVVFTAELAPGQMSRFDSRLETLPEKPKPQLKAKGGKIIFKNGEMEVAINTTTGLIDRYRVAGKDYLKEGAFQALVIADNEDAWGMTVKSYRKLAGRFKLLTPKASARFSGVRVPELDAVRVIEDGAVRTVVEAVFGYKESFICQQYLLPKQGTEIEVFTRVMWGEKDKMLKLSLPSALGNARLLGQVACGVEELQMNGNEVVCQKWCALLDEKGERALTVIDDGIYGADGSDGELRLSLLRSPAYSGHPIGDRPIVPQDRFTPRFDQGERVYRFWLNAGAASERLDHIDREALTKNEKPFALSFFPMSVDGAKPKAVVTLSDDVVQVQAIKRAEDGDDLVIRLFEPTGHPRTTTIALPYAGFKQTVKLGAFEIKTLRYNKAAGTLTETNLLEEC